MPRGPSEKKSGSETGIGAWGCARRAEPSRRGGYVGARAQAQLGRANGMPRFFWKVVDPGYEDFHKRNPKNGVPY